LQRDEIRLLYAGMEFRAARADRAVAQARRVAPLIAVGGMVVVLAFRPRRVLGIVRRGLTIALYALSARQTLKGSLASGLDGWGRQAARMTDATGNQHDQPAG
jgi:hypothetical protein